MEREVQELRRKLASGAGASNGATTTTVAGIQFAGRFLEGAPARELKSMADALKQEIGSGVVAIAASYDGKASLVVGVTADLAERISAVDLVRAGVAGAWRQGAVVVGRIWPRLAAPMPTERQRRWWAVEAALADLGAS